MADNGNNRVLIFDSPWVTGQSATVVLGQVDFTSLAPATTSTGLSGTANAITDAQGNAWISDSQNSRVLQYKPPFTTAMAASVVLGQASFTTNVLSMSPNGLAFPHGMAFDKSGNLWVADSYNSRVVEFIPPFISGMASALALGQNGNGTGGCTTNGFGLCYPTDLAFDAQGNLWIVDNGNNRVLKYDAPFVPGQSPATVLGQANFTAVAPAAGARGLDNPSGIAIDATGNLWVSDGLNWRVLEFSPPFSNGQAATLVLGSPDFTATVNTDPQSKMGNPRGVAFDRDGNLFVADLNAPRVMVFAPPFSSGMEASKVIGQPTFSSVGSLTTASGLWNPVGLHISF